jgi:hypothetical protein
MTILVSLAALLIPAPAGAAASLRNSGASILRARTINHVSIDVSDVSRSKAFYQNLGDLRSFSRSEKRARQDSNLRRPAVALDASLTVSGGNR